MNPDTIKRVRAEADAYAEQVSRAVSVVGYSAMGPYVDTAAIEDALRAAFLRGADAGYTASQAEERQP
jgi:hypothetical protein